MNATVSRSLNRTFQLSKIITPALLAGVLALVLTACSSGGGALVGKWQGTDATDVMEFRANGTFHIAGAEPMNGTYSVSGDQLQLQLDGALGKALGKITARIVLEGDTLKMTADGETEVYKRVK